MVQRIILNAVMTLLALCLFAVTCEFFLQEQVKLFLYGHCQPEPMAVHINHIVVAIVFSALAIVISSFLNFRYARDLQRSEKALKAKVERHRNFAADVAHELRTPLAVLRANIDALDITRPAPLDALRHDVAIMSRIVEQLLARTRLDSMVIAVNEQADLAEVSRTISAFLAPYAISEARSLEVIGAETPLIVRGNAPALEQALCNLIENAIKYSPRGTKIILEVLAGEKEHVIMVSNRGRGIPEGMRESIFKRFLRADRRGGGAGLGLSIVQRVMEMHGGKVTVEDAPGGGARFSLRIPVQGSR
ncbi:sensor histidine kinase [Varunaivibrio sulfuroxidans]|uniref:histidine kinase n=1 Tax=Varunaivibrio sulfuroxidans TaxID=1773489 RepID=A0A4V2UNH0_9PROT|nr:HAMP domain-containing sensor histidine kinase [Varunaivibrio sulfuroxidans]TCS62081.1 phospho-acceptor domain-containing protein [Varunaivibrio sulfuroxidans]WES30514.1 HAMP domain-containing sensor histidine kinase [Varunaivibrio sulfuroxidans]